VREGLVDAVTPMAYTGQMERFAEFVKDFHRPEWGGKSVAGHLGRIHAQPASGVADAVGGAAGLPGVAIFFHSELYPMKTVTRRVVRTL
jgi:hypothetical protein